MRLALPSSLTGWPADPALLGQSMPLTAPPAVIEQQSSHVILS
jgi:hypothetical protein